MAKIEVFVVAYHLSDGKKEWLPQGLGKKEAFAAAKELADDGFRARVYRFKVKPATLFSSLTLRSTHTITLSNTIDRGKSFEQLMARAKQLAKANEEVPS